jgi:ABC-type bacteriocin/lantibiotic exporter with double-glycine peptidase domain
VGPPFSGRRRFLLLLVPALAGCFGRGVPRKVARDPSWVVVRDVPFVKQEAEADCGAAAIGMVLSYWTSPVVLDALRGEIAPERGLKAGRLRDFAKAHGLEAFLVKGELDDLEHELTRGRPVLVGLLKRVPGRKEALAHYEVVVGLSREKGAVGTFDPASGFRKSPLKDFLAEWDPAKRLMLVVFPLGS